MPPSIRSACREKIRSLIGEYGFEAAAIELELVGAVDPAELAHAQAMVETALTPCRPEIAKRELARLRASVCTREADQGNLNLTFAAYAEALIEYPPDVVITACQEWAQRERFWPALAEILAVCDRLASPRRRLREAVRANPTELPDYTETRRLVAERDRQWAEAAAWRQAHPELMGMPADRLPRREIAVREQDRRPLRDLSAELATFRARFMALSTDA